MRARYPDREGHAGSRGVAVLYEIHGTGDPEALAHAIADGLGEPVLYREVETDGAARAASLIAPLV